MKISLNFMQNFKCLCEETLSILVSLIINIIILFVVSVNSKSAFILTASVLVTSALILGLSTAQTADAKKVTVYCADFPAPFGTDCRQTLQECEDRREFLAANFGVTSDPCYERRDKVDKH